MSQKSSSIFSESLSGGINPFYLHRNGMPYALDPQPYYLPQNPQSPSQEACDIPEDILQECADTLLQHYAPSSGHDCIAYSSPNESSESAAIDGWADILTLNFPVHIPPADDTPVAAASSELMPHVPNQAIHNALPAIVTAPAPPACVSIRNGAVKPYVYNKKGRRVKKPYDGQPHWHIASSRVEPSREKQPIEDMHHVMKNVIREKNREHMDTSPDSTVQEIRQNILRNNITVDTFTKLMTERKFNPRTIKSFALALATKDKDAFIETVIQKLNLVEHDKLYPPYTHKQYIQALKPVPAFDNAQGEPRTIRKKQLAHIQAANNSLDLAMIATFAATQPSLSTFKRYLNEIKPHLSSKQRTELFDHYAKNPLQEIDLQRSLNALIKK